jgi:hypothetical protein
MNSQRCLIASVRYKVGVSNAYFTLPLPFATEPLKPRRESWLLQREEFDHIVHAGFSSSAIPVSKVPVVEEVEY